VVKDYSQTVMLTADRLDTGTLDRLFAPIFGRARSELLDEGLSEADIQLLPALDMRYVGQSYELTIPLVGRAPDTELPGAAIALDASRAVDDFHKAHRRRFSYASTGEPVEIVNLRLKAVGKTAKPESVRRPTGRVDPKAAHVGYKQIYFAASNTPRAARPVPTALYDRARLSPGNIVVGPAVIFQMDTTTVIPPRWAATVDEWGNLAVEIGQV
jgi:N-methylhydantoinase A